MKVIGYMGRQIKLKGRARKLDFNRVNRARINADRPGFDEKFKHPRSLRATPSIAP